MCSSLSFSTESDTSPNHHVIACISSALLGTYIPSVSAARAHMHDLDFRCELDSHANMCVFGADCSVFEWSGKSCSVTPFTDSLGQAQDVPICDLAVAYDYVSTDLPETLILIFRNALVIPNMNHHLVPPFILREGGHIVNDVPKYQLSEPTVDDHCILLSGTDPVARIPLQLSGIFSFFHTRKPTDDEIIGCTKIIMTPDSEFWNPYCDSFALNEKAMTTYSGELSDFSRRERHLMQDDDIDHTDPDILAASLSAFDYHLNAVASSAFVSPPVPPVYSDGDPNVLLQRLSDRAEISKLTSSLASLDITVPDPDDLFATVSSLHTSTASGVTKDFLSKIWMVSEKHAQRAIEHNTQLCRQQGEDFLSRNYSTNDRMLRYKRLKSTFYTDTLLSSVKSRPRQNTCAQLFVSDKGFVAVYPMKSQSEFDQALRWFCKEVGVAYTLIMDGHKAQVNLDTTKFCNQVGTILRKLEVGTPWANRAELYIGMLKSAVRKDLRRSHAPLVLWDYCIERRALIHNAVPRDLFQANGLSPHEITFGTEGDISNLCRFNWYDWVYYNDPNSYPYNKMLLGRVLGPIKNEGNEMAQAVLTVKGTVVPRRTVRPLTKAEENSESEKQKRTEFDRVITAKLGNSIALPDKSPPHDDYIPYEDGTIDPISVDDIESDPVDEKGISYFEQPAIDHLIHAEVNLPQGENMQLAKVLRRSTDDTGKNIGHFDDNPYLNTLVYDVQFPDGSVKEYAANIIAENLYSQVDENGHSYTLLDNILDHKKTEQANDSRYVTTRSGRRRLRKSTAGWKLLVSWKDGSQQWVPLSIMKESNPVDVAEYAKSVGIDQEPAFHWWVPYTIRKRDRIIAAVSSRVKKTTHKYGIEIPNTIQQAMAIDEKNGDTHWKDAIEKEMSNLKVAFDILEHDENLPPGWTKSSGHLVFDVRMTLERKARWVKDGHKTPEPSWSTYAGVVSRESVRIAFTYASLMGLDVCACDIQNAYLQAPSSEKHFIICGPEFGLENVGKKAKIVRALYGGKSAGADYWRHVRKAMSEMGFQSCKADPDVWFRPSINSQGIEYYEYVLLYTDDILAIGETPEQFIREELDQCFVVKPKSIGKPAQYLGNKVSEVELENGRKAWSFSSSQYTQNAVKNVESYLKKKGESLPKKATSPWTRDYRPETDTSPELSPADSSYFQSLIGVLRWIVELNRVDIAMEVSALASMMAMPRQGHLQQIFHMFAFLKAKHNASMVFDPTEPDIDESKFVKEDWSAAAYGECTEEIPSNAPKPRGVAFTIRAFVDSDHAGDVVTRRSRTGFIVFLNSSPIYWFTKKQTGIETSSFGSEFIAMKQCCEYIRGLRYKLRMMGIPVEGHAYIFGDNQSVLANTSKPHSTLKKKSSSIAYHFVREGVAKDEWRTTYLNTHFNPSDMLTKSLPGGEKRTRFTSYVLYYVGA